MRNSTTEASNRGRGASNSGKGGGSSGGIDISGMNESGGNAPRRGGRGGYIRISDCLVDLVIKNE